MVSIFTFHNVSINSQSTKERLYRYVVNLHSTMFLLILEGCVDKDTEFFKFTFHNVSINSKSNLPALPVETYLHSTMFLLIPIIFCYTVTDLNHLHSTMFLLILRSWQRLMIRFIFTFHNVSINSEYFTDKKFKYSHLHSTMFLLIRVLRNTRKSIN